MTRKSNANKRTNNLVDCTDGLPEEIPFVRKKASNDPWEYHTTDNSDNHDTLGDFSFAFENHSHGPFRLIPRIGSFFKSSTASVGKLFRGRHPWNGMVRQRKGKGTLQSKMTHEFQLAKRKTSPLRFAPILLLGLSLCLVCVGFYIAGNKLKDIFVAKIEHLPAEIPNPPLPKQAATETTSSTAVTRDGETQSQTGIVVNRTPLSPSSGKRDPLPQNLLLQLGPPFEAKVPIPRPLSSAEFVGKHQADESTPLKDGGTRIVHVITANTTLEKILDKYGLDPKLAKPILAELKALVSHHKDSTQKIKLSTNLKIASELTLELDPNHQLKKVIFPQSSGYFVEVERSQNSSFKASLKEIPRFFREYTAVGRITSSLAADAAKVGVSYEVIDDFVDMFSDRVVFHQDLQPGDHFAIIFQEETLENGTPLGHYEIIATYLSLQGEQLAAIRYRGKDGKYRFFNEKGELLGDNFLRYPLKFSRISSLFSDSRMHPVLKIKKPHNGVDFVAPVGTPIRTVAQGTIDFAGWQGPSGQMVKIQHNGRYSTAYCHLNSISRGLKKGVKVERGQIIGTLGGTGRVTGPHLHYAFYDSGKFTDPLKMKLPTIDLLGPGTNIENAYLSRAMSSLSDLTDKQYHKLLNENVQLQASNQTQSGKSDLFSVIEQLLKSYN